MSKVFISYNQADRQWAEWIGWQLEEQGHGIILQAWDFRPGSNFVLEMQEAAKDAERTIAVFSPDYLAALYTQPEWAAAFAQDPDGKKGILLPVRVRKCELEGLLKAIIYIDLVGLEEERAKEVLIQGMSRERAKPDISPAFPVQRTVPGKPAFPLEHIYLSKLPTTDARLFGREKELDILDNAWDQNHTHMVTLIAWGGVGKTALVNRWVQAMGKDDFRGAQKVYAWSFYSQGAAEGKQASADEFMQYTLKWFGDPDPTQGSAVDKGRRLANLVRKSKTLLILDGMEPLQYPPGKGHGLDGQLKDQGLKTLLKELAGHQTGLCVITSREGVTDLSGYAASTVKEIALDHLSDTAGAELLKHLGIKGREKDISDAVEDYGGHALALTLLGRYIDTVYQGDIRKRDKLPALTKERSKGGHARRVMEAYCHWLGDSPERDILQMLGLFDRPAEKGAIEVLKADPSIPGVTEQLQQLTEEDWQYALANLRGANLLAAENPQKPGDLDCHPLVREHFGEKLMEQNPKGWKIAHTRLYHYYMDLPEKELPDTLEEMEPLFAAIAHGCQAGRHQEAAKDVYSKRILRGPEEAFIVKKLGAFGSFLSALSHFFEVPWSRPAAGLSEAAKSAVLGWSAFGLRAVGRLQEAGQLTKAGLERRVKQEDWKNAAATSGNLSELMLTLGQVSEAVVFARQSVTHADRSGHEFQRMVNRTTLADALHQSGQLEEAERLFREAEEMQKKQQPEYHFLYSLGGFRFCDLLLERRNYREVMERVGQTIEIAKRNNWLLPIALDQLSLGRAWMMQAQEEEKVTKTKKSAEAWARAKDFLDQAVTGLLESGDQDMLALALLKRATYYRLQGDFSRAWADLTEAQEIAEMGTMRLHMCDYHLEAGRLCKAQKNKQEAKEHFKKVKEMIEEMGYHRRRKEVE